VRGSIVREKEASIADQRPARKEKPRAETGGGKLNVESGKKANKKKGGTCRGKKSRRTGKPEKTAEK